MSIKPISKLLTLFMQYCLPQLNQSDISNDDNMSVFSDVDYDMHTDNDEIKVNYPDENTNNNNNSDINVNSNNNNNKNNNNNTDGNLDVDFDSWSLSEFLYILDNVCNERNLRVLSDIRKKIQRLNFQKSSNVNESDQKQFEEELKMQYEQLKSIEITGYDFLHNCQSLGNFIMQFKINYNNYWLDITGPTMQDLTKFMDSVKEFSHQFFLQGK